MLIMIGLAAGSRAQLSPGKLSLPHAELDSSRSCPACHATGKGVTPELCLSCHVLLGQRITAGAGLHARPDYQRCETCHIEHHGREFELIWWGEAGMGSFDHADTGHALEGAHRMEDCRTCHRASNIARPAPLLAAGKDLDRTFLGLGAACAGCHQDPHRGQMAPRACSECHGQAVWQPAPGFDHARTGFPLDGRHAQTECSECHATETDAEGSWVRYADVSTACADCHRDPHAGRLGRDCAACHITADWNRVDTARFNHDLTRFPLRGRHIRVDCAGCHQSGSFRVEHFELCESCHADVHAGQFRGRGATPDGGTECSECHDTRGFVPSRFDLTDHAATDFPLDGAHASVHCADCHGMVATADLVALGVAVATSSSPASIRDFSIEVTGCVDCHRDPHAGTADAFLGDAGCESCHDGEDWRTVTFDHDATGFALEGAHRTVACAECHRGVIASAPADTASQVILSFEGAPTVCRDCHDDPHLGQFDQSASPVDCSRCHSPEGWTPPLFEHDRDSRFALEGAHARAECGACHRVETVGDREVVRYKPLPTVCSGCHVAAPHPDPLLQGEKGLEGPRDG